MTKIKDISKSRYTEIGHEIRVSALAPAAHQDLREWRGSNTRRRCADLLDSVDLDGLFNRTNKVGGVVVINAEAYANVSTKLRELIERVLQRHLPLPHPLADIYTSTFIGTLIVDGVGRTPFWTLSDLPPDSFMVLPQKIWLTPLKNAAK
ncbi:MAG: hypothetical protein P4L53_04800 [Candidatus Obscuribacterales bacterium]|nr:hypothetical protein [Candidatus Obscuribacterales bacterium]